MALMAIVGFSAAGTQTTMFALGAHLYPTVLRATGLGAILGIGRLGLAVAGGRCWGTVGPGGTVVQTITYAWSRPADDMQLVFTLTTSSNPTAPVQAMATVALTAK